MIAEPVCKMCGACCHYMLDGKIKRCKFLVKKGDRLMCRIYRNRIGTLIDKSKIMGVKVYCGMREHLWINFPDCPFNKEGGDIPFFDPFNGVKPDENKYIQTNYGERTRKA